MTKTSRDDFEALIRRAGLSLSPTQVEQIHEGWALVEPMLDRIRGTGRDRAAEPAHIFRAEAYTQRSGETKIP
jgi:hypothetical protein